MFRAEERIYKSNNKYDLCHELYVTSFAKVHSPNVHEWCIKACSRIGEQYDIDIQYKNPVQFIDELIAHNIIQEIH